MGLICCVPHRVNMENVVIENAPWSANYLVGHNDLILRRIFSFLNLEELKNCRLVSTDWLEISQPIFNKKSVIKLQYDITQPELGDNIGSNHQFLLEFKDAPLYNTFDGIEIAFDFVFNFKWNTDDPIMKLLELYGKRLRYIKLKVVLYESAQFDFFPMKNIFSELVPELEHLCVEVEMLDRTISGTTLEILEKHTGTGMQLLKLKKLEWSTVYADWKYDYVEPNENHRAVFTSVFLDLMNSSPNLKSVLTEGSLLNAEAFDSVNLNEEIISGLEEITICLNDYLYPVAPCLNKLVQLSEKGLELSSFFVKAEKQGYYDNDDEDNNEKYFYISLVNFINTQKNSLRILELQCRQNIEGESSLLQDIPELTTMSKLELLKVDVSGMNILSKNHKDIWKRFFPSLKSWYLSFSDEEIQKQEDIVFSYLFLSHLSYPRFLCNLDEHINLRFLRLNFAQFHHNLESENGLKEDSKNAADVCYEGAVAKFPNINAFQLFQEVDGLLHTFRGSKANYTCVPITDMSDNVYDLIFE